MFSSCDCILVHLRGKEDVINPIASGNAALIAQFTLLCHRTLTSQCRVDIVRMCAHCSGALTGAILSAREGARAAARSALFGGAVLALIEGVAHFLQTWTPKEPPPMPPMPTPHFEGGMGGMGMGGMGGMGGPGFGGPRGPPPPPGARPPPPPGARPPPPGQGSQGYGAPGYGFARPDYDAPMADKAKTFSS